MRAAWTGVTAFFDMGGYAWFVWPAFGAHRRRPRRLGAGERARSEAPGDGARRPRRPAATAGCKRSGRTRCISASGSASPSSASASPSLGVAAAIILTQLQEHLVFFHSPSQLRGKPELIADRQAPHRRSCRGRQRREARVTASSASASPICASRVPVRLSRHPSRSVPRRAGRRRRGADARGRCSPPTRCSPSTTRTTCRPRSPMPSSNRDSGSTCARRWRVPART